MNKILRFLGCFLCLCAACFTSYSQISVSSFEQLETDLDANTWYPKKDINGKTCAIIKIYTTQTGFLFDNGALGIVATEYKPAEIWVYVPDGTMKFKITHPQLGHISNSDREGFYWLPGGRLKSGSVYRMDIITGTVHTIVEEAKIKTGWLIVNSVPEGADIYLSKEGEEEKHIGVTPITQKIPQGSYQYRAKRYNHRDDVGVFNLNGGRHQLDIRLTPLSEQNTALNDSINIKRGNIGAISINSTPEGASVYLNGVETGKKTPCVLENVVSGKHDIRLRLTNYAPANKVVTVTTGQTVNVDAALEARFAPITINTLPKATIKANGVVLGTGSLTENLQEGVYDLEASLAGHETVTKQIEVQVNKPQNLNLKPIPVYGSMDILSSPLGANITVNGEPYGDTPKTIDSLLIGEYDVVLTLPGYAPLTKRVTVYKDTPITINEKLEKEKKVEPVVVAQEPVENEVVEEKKPVEVTNNNKPVDVVTKKEPFVTFGLEGSFGVASKNSYSKSGFGIGATVRLGRTSSLVNVILGARYQSSSVSKTLAYDFLDYESYNTFKGSASYKNSMTDVVIPAILNFNLSKVYVGVGYELGLAIGNKESFTPSAEGFDEDVYQAYMDYLGEDTTPVSFPSSSVVLQAGLLHRHFDVKVFCKMGGAMTIGAGVGYYF